MEIPEEKAPNMGVTNVQADTERGDVESITPRHGHSEVKRDLQRRHINMIAIAGQ